MAVNNVKCTFYYGGKRFIFKACGAFLYWLNRDQKHQGQRVPGDGKGAFFEAELPIRIFLKNKNS